MLVPYNVVTRPHNTTHDYITWIYVDAVQFAANVAGMLAIEEAISNADYQPTVIEVFTASHLIYKITIEIDGLDSQCH